MKNVQKLVLVPIEKWEKLGQNEPVKEVSVKTVPLKSPSLQMKAQVKNQHGQGIVRTSPPFQMFPYLSPKKRNRGLLLLHHLRKNKDIKWNKKGELFYKGKVLPKSDVNHLITHAIQNDKSRPNGMKSFYKILAKANIPKKLILNKEGRHHMKKVLHEKDIDWRPPGRLNKR